MRLSTWWCERVMICGHAVEIFCSANKADYKIPRAQCIPGLPNVCSQPPLPAPWLPCGPTFLYASFQPKQPNPGVLLIACFYWRVEAWSTITAQGKQEIASHLTSDTICPRESLTRVPPQNLPFYAFCSSPVALCTLRMLTPVSRASLSFPPLGSNLFVLPCKGVGFRGVHHSHFIQTIRNASKLK